MNLNGPTLPVYHLSSQSPEELSCSLMLTLAPWCSIINSTGRSIKVTNLTSNEFCTVDANNIAMPFHINVSSNCHFQSRSLNFFSNRTLSPSASTSTQTGLKASQFTSTPTSNGQFPIALLCPSKVNFS